MIVLELVEGAEKQKKFETFSKQQLIERLEIVEAECARLAKDLYSLRQQDLNEEQLRLILEEQLAGFREQVYGASSEKYKKKPTVPKAPQDRKPRVKKPSERYPNVPVEEEVIGLEGAAPKCEGCHESMMDTGLREVSEQLTVIPKKYKIIRQLRVKWKCSCQSCLKTAEAPARILPGSSYSDEMIIDVALSKYCDLIPIERYAKMAARGGLKGLPAQSLIETTHALAEFYKPVYEQLRAGVLSSRVLHADETPHKMLEGSPKKGWYLWGFANNEHSYFECHSTRSGDVASSILKDAVCEYLMSDVYSGYGKATREANLTRAQNSQGTIKNVYCNAHARRCLFKSWQSKYKQAEFYLEHYSQIYELWDREKNKAPPEKLELRSQMKPHFEVMRERACEELPGLPDKNQYAKALRYYLKNYDGLSRCLDDSEIPLDNNLQERLLRNPVVGRKTWYGTHSKLGAKTMAILFSIVESCKLGGINPREYFDKSSKDMLAGQPPYTPAQFHSKN